MKKLILTTLSILIIGLILTNISCEKLEVKRVIKIKTVEYLNVTSNSAEIMGTLLDVGENGIMDWGFCYTDASGEPDINSAKVDPTGSPGKGDFKALIEGLEPNMEYHVKAFARSDSEVKYGEMLTFTTLVAEKITITSPVSTDRWPLESTRQITWTDNIDADVRIELWRVNETNAYMQITDMPVASTGTYDWSIPTNIPIDAGWRVKIISTQNENTFAFSDDFEIIAAQTIEVIGPSGGQYVHMGNTYSVDWQSNFGGNVKISLFKNNTIHSDIITSTENNNAYVWQVPNDGSIIADADYSINITSLDDYNIYHTGTWFQIAEAPFISISAPTSGANWQMGDTYTITWTDNIVESVRIELYKGATLEMEIANNESSDGTYSWAIPTGMVDGSDYKIKITGVINGTTAVSGQFTISEVPETTGTVDDIDGNTYPTVKIGNQWWMAENLKVTHYDNSGVQGALIPYYNDAQNSEWAALGDNETDKGYCFYTGEGDTYGALYTWAAAMNGNGSSTANPSGIQGVCPTGWHLPSDAEWKELEMQLKMTPTEADSESWRGLDQGGKLKATGDLTTGDGLWTSPNTGATNESLLTALPGGSRSSDTGVFNNLGGNGYFWSTTNYSSTGNMGRNLGYNTATVYRGPFAKSFGLSVRCVKD
ncbi:MAG: FISUMP domain-containing protein [Bacteroidota bacterium]